MRVGFLMTRYAPTDRSNIPVVVQGESDSFGMPGDAPNRRVVKVVGDHSLSADLDTLRAAVRSWLAEIVPAA